jgi:ATP-binding cassette subfamily B protein
LRVIERGTTSIETLFNTIVFSIGPTLFDVGTVCVVFVSYGESVQAAIVFVTILLYCGLTWVLTEWRTKFRQQQNEADNKSDQKAIDSLLNFETVKYFTGEEMEARQYESVKARHHDCPLMNYFARYEKNLLAYSDAAWKSEASLLLLDGVQAFLLNGGLLLGLLLAAKNIVDGTNSLGNIILVNSYLLQVLKIGFFPIILSIYILAPTFSRVYLPTTHSFAGGRAFELARQQLSNDSARICRHGEHGRAHEIRSRN